MEKLSQTDKIVLVDFVKTRLDFQLLSKNRFSTIYFFVQIEFNLRVCEENKNLNVKYTNSTK